MENQYSSQIIKLFNAKEVDLGWSIFDSISEDALWRCANDIINSDFGLCFLEMVNENFSNLSHLNQAKVILFKTLEDTANPLVFKSALTALFKNEKYLDSEDFSNLESIASQKFNSSCQDFIREKSIETLVLLTLSGKGSRYRALALLEEVIEHDLPLYLTLKIIKLLGLLYHYKPDNDVKKLIEKKFNSSDYMISSEVAYNAGLIYLRSALETRLQENLISGLNEASVRFSQSCSLIENRDDAKFYVTLIKIFLKMLSGTCDSINEEISSLRETTYRRILFEQGQTDDSFLEISIYELIQSLDQAQQKLREIDSWLDISEEVLSLAKVYGCHRRLDVSNMFHQSLLINFNDSIMESLFIPQVQVSLFTRLNAAYQKLEKIKQLYIDSLPREEIEFLDLLLEYCISRVSDAQDPKKKALEDKALVALAQKKGKPIEEIRKEIGEASMKGQFEQYLIDQVSYLGSLVTNKYLQGFKTGFFPGDEVLLDLEQEIRSNLPNYPEEKFLAFMTILQQVIKYTVYVRDAQRNDKGHKRDFLFSKEAGGLGQAANEEELQNDLFEFLVAGTSLTQFLSYEKKDVASGRVDILVDFGDLRYPIEIKKELNNINRHHIEKMYISQTQTYTASYEQLGIFVVLDLTPKLKGQPSVNIRDQFYLAHLAPQDGLKIRYPDFVIVAIVTGNKILPSQHSTYSKK